MPLVSVIVPCYNIAGYIRRCVASILAQREVSLEILLVDDGSADGTGAVCDELAKEHGEIRVFHQTNAGPGVARNTGVENARGEILAFADGDDRMLPDMLRTLIRALEDTGADIAVCPYLAVSTEEEIPAEAQKTPEEKPAVRTLTRDEALYALIAEDDDLVIQNAAWNKVYRRAVFDRIRYPGGRYEDIETSARLLYQAERVAYVDRQLYVYSLDRGTSIMNGSGRQSIIEEQIPAYAARDAFLAAVGRSDLVDMHDYMVVKKLLLLYTQARREVKREEAASFLEGIGKAIRGICEGRFEALYTTPISDPHQKLRTRLFLTTPVLYNAFMDVNDGFVLPLRAKLRVRRTGGVA